MKRRERLVVFIVALFMGFTMGLAMGLGLGMYLATPPTVSMTDEDIELETFKKALQTGEVTLP